MALTTVVFDLDDTLAASKSAITPAMAALLDELLAHYTVAVISGGRFEQFQQQLLANLPTAAGRFEKLHILPTCGTRYYRYDPSSAGWVMQYSEDFSDHEKQQIIDAVSEGARALGLWEEKPWGEIIEDRGSQITFSALGQQAPVDAKTAWDPDSSKKRRLRDWVAERLPEFEVRVGGKTSVDITKAGIDKSYGMRRLMDALGLDEEQILFIGDRLEEGGNDYPVKAMGIQSFAVEGFEETLIALRALLTLRCFNP